MVGSAVDISSVVVSLREKFKDQNVVPRKDFLKAVEEISVEKPNKLLTKENAEIAWIMFDVDHDEKGLLSFYYLFL